MQKLDFIYFLQAKEIEVQTHCDVKVLLKPNWQRGKTHEYCSSRQSQCGDIVFERVQKNIPDPELVMPSPKKRECMFMPKQNKLAVLGVAEFVERVMITVIGLSVVTKIK